MSEYHDVLKLSPAEQKDRVWKRLQQRRLSSSSEEVNQDLGMLGIRDDSKEGKCPMRKSSSNLEWPTYKTIMDDITNSDYNRVLESPHDMLHSSQLSNSSSSSKKTRTKFTKAFCPHGTICCAKMELFPQKNGSSNTSYSGLLAPAKTVEHCIIRLSSAMKPPAAERNKFGTFFLKATGGKLRNAKLFPMVAIKAFRQNVRSGNLLFAGRKIGQSSAEFFRHCLCTQMTERVPTLLRPFIQKFYSYSINPLSLGVSDFCSSNEDGEAAMENFPYVVMLNPVYGKGRNTDGPGDDSFETFDEFIDDLLKVPSGTILFDIFACPDPHSALDAKKIQRIGRIVSTSEMIVSTPDDGLFFRHQKKEEDFELRPEWKEQVKATCSPDGGKTVGTIDRLVGSTIMEQLIDANQYIDFEKTGQT